MIAIVSLTSCNTYSNSNKTTTSEGNHIVSESDIDISEQTEINNKNSDNTDNDTMPYEIDDITINTLLKNAEIFTVQLVECSIPQIMILNNEPIEDTEIWSFLMCIFISDESPYYSFCEYLDQETIIYNLSDLQVVAYEVFGIENWFYNPDDDYDEDTKKFTMCTAKGLFQGSRISDLKTEITDDIIKTEGALSCIESVNGDPELVEVGTYQCIYRIMEENSNYFLRLESYEFTE